MVTLVLTAADLADQLSVYSSSRSKNLAVSRGQGRGETFRLSHSHAHTHEQTLISNHFLAKSHKHTYP